MRFSRVLATLGGLVLAGFAIAGLVSPASLLPAADRADAIAIFAEHVAVRNLALALALFVVVARADRRGLGVLAAVMAAIQLGDAALQVVHGHPAHALGPLVIAALFAASARSLGSRG